MRTIWNEVIHEENKDGAGLDRRRRQENRECRKRMWLRKGTWRNQIQRGGANYKKWVEEGRREMLKSETREIRRSRRSEDRQRRRRKGTTKGEE